MATKAEGQWPCTVLGATTGEDNGVLVARINVRIDGGPDEGKFATYEDQVTNKSAPYVARTCKAVGWQGKSLSTTLEGDVAAWIEKTGGKSTVEIRHIEIKRGKKYDKWVDGGMKGPAPVWDKVQSIGVGPKPLAAPSASTAKDADDFMQRALEEAGDYGSAPPMDDVPHAGTGPEEDIPFVSSAWTRVNGGVL